MGIRRVATAALLACALAAGAVGAQFTSKIGIRFVEATITDPPTPLSDGIVMAEPEEDGSGDSYEAAPRAWFPKVQRRCE